MAKAKFRRSVELVPFIAPKMYTLKLNLVPRDSPERTIIGEVVLSGLPNKVDVIQGTYRVRQCWCHQVSEAGDLVFWADVEAV